MEWVKNVERAAIRQNATTGPAKLLLAKVLLEDGALQAFENAARTAGAKMTQNYKAVIKAVTAHIIPKKALQKQKHHMRRFLKTFGREGKRLRGTSCDYK